MENIKVPNDSSVIVGPDSFDDAGVYRLTDEIAVIQTVDFFTPIVDDPYIYGQIAACNALSDVYAMGGKPLTALNIVCFPVNKFSLDVLKRVLEGGLDILNKGGVQLLGGHSVEDDEMKYGLSVTGIVHPDKVITNNGLRNGDVLVLTKPLGTGIISTAIKRKSLNVDEVDDYIEVMRTLNDVPSEVMQDFEVHACTDVTGFGLIGHLKEMMAKDKLEIKINTKSLPLLTGVLESASKDMIPGGLNNNRKHIGPFCHVETSVSKEIGDIIFDPQTSGGLLIALPENQGDRMISELRSRGIDRAEIIGAVINSDGQKIRVL